jgi:hypothetical protein
LCKVTFCATECAKITPLNRQSYRQPEGSRPVG